MNIFWTILAFLFFTFIGFALGRLGDKWGGHLNGPHHWIPGLVLMIGGGMYWQQFWGIMAISFGIGLFVSDLNDFLHGRIWGVDEPHEWKFWSIM